MPRLNRRDTAKLLIQEKETAVQAELGTDTSGNPISDYVLRVVTRISEELNLTDLIAQIEQEQKKGE